MGAGASLGAAGVYAFSSLLAAETSQAATLPQAPAPFEPPTASSALPNRLTGSFVSAARGGIKTNYVIAMPPGQSKMLRPVIALHGVDGDANQMIDMGVPDGLARLAKEGKPPFAVVGVDGGNTYWHKRTSGEDSGAMVLDELLPMLSTMGFDTSRVGFMGWSMGGYGRFVWAPSWARPGLPESAPSARPCTRRTRRAPRARSTATRTSCRTA